MEKEIDYEIARSLISEMLAKCSIKWSELNTEILEVELELKRLDSEKFSLTRENAHEIIKKYTGAK